MGNTLAKCKTLNEIIEFGDDSINIVRDTSSKISVIMDNRDDNTSILRTLNSIFNTVDYGELSLLKTPQGGFSGVVSKILKTRDKLYSKYKSITEQFNDINYTLIDWEMRLKENNTILEELREALVDCDVTLENHIAEAELDIELIEDAEMNSILRQKINDLQYHLKLSEQLKETIKMLSITNYGIYRKLIGIRSTTIPTIEIYTNIFRVIKEHNEMIESFKTLDEKRNQLIRFSTKETIELGKKAIGMVGYNKEDFELINSTIKEYEVGMKEILQLQNRKNEEALYLIGRGV